MTLRLLIAGSAAEEDAARQIEARVFLETFGNTPETMEQEYGRYADRSRFVTVIDDATGSAVGAARIIVPDAAGDTVAVNVSDDPAVPVAGVAVTVVDVSVFCGALTV